jgi:hypothetical protein
MATLVRLSIREILGVSGDVAGYLHDQTRKCRVPIESVVANSSVASAEVNSVMAKSYYTLPSGYAKVTLEDRVVVNATLVNGSKVNLMPKGIFDLLELPIDRYSLAHQCI